MDAPGLALVLSGGGARAAYQVGVLRYLAREFPTAVPDILTGVSAGGINAAFLAARQEPYPEKIEELSEMWRDLHINQVFDVSLGDLVWRGLRWTGRLASGGKSPLPHAKSMVDTAPLREVLERELPPARGIAPASDQFIERPAARCADGAEPHDRAVDHMGADPEDDVMPSWSGRR
jgi:NTE family protein